VSAPNGLSFSAGRRSALAARDLNRRPRNCLTIVNDKSQKCRTNIVFAIQDSHCLVEKDLRCMSHVTIIRRPRRVVVLSQIINLQISMSRQYCLLFYAAIATMHATLLRSANWLVHDIRQQIQGGHRHFLRSVGRGDDAAIRALAREEFDDTGAMGSRKPEQPPSLHVL
jgi:hypothetical protein